MNNILVRILCGLLLISTLCSDGFAVSRDTTVLLANNNLNTPAEISIKRDANIVYPGSFEID